MVSVFANCTIPAGDADVGSVVVSVIIHATWEGCGLHIPLSPHTELGGEGVNPCH